MRAEVRIAGTVVALMLAGCGSDENDDGTEEAQQSAPAAMDIELTGADGAQIGPVTLTEESGAVKVTAELEGLEPGFHGFHIHETGACDPDAVVEGEPTPFGSAEGHYTKGSEGHGEHSGDMPPLLVKEDGTVATTFTTDRYTLADIQDADGSAVMVHADPDNSANIPADRYRSKGAGKVPDQMTLDTGDSGDRVACGVVGPK